MTITSGIYFENVVNTARQMSSTYGDNWTTLSGTYIIDMLKRYSPIADITYPVEVNGVDFTKQIAIRENELTAYPSLVDEGYKNAGVPNYSTRSSGISYLKSYVEIDTTGYMLKDAVNFLITESMQRAVDAIKYETERQYFYGNRVVDRRESLGIANVLNGKNEFKKQIIDAGSTKTSGLTSVYIVTQGREISPLLLPPASFTMLGDKSMNIGNVNVRMVNDFQEKQPDGSIRLSNRMFFTYAFGYAFLVPELCSRICNIEIDEVEANNIDLSKLIFKALVKSRRNMSQANEISIFMNRELFFALMSSFKVTTPASTGIDTGARFDGTAYRTQIDMNGGKNTLSPQYHAELMNFGGINANVYTMDAITSNESRVTIA